MKKILITAAMLLAITTSVIAGSLALYTTQIDKLAEGGVVAKEFVLLEGGTDTFVKNVKIAPTETSAWKFSVKNFSGAVVSETAMDLSFNVAVVPAQGKQAIAPLTVVVTDESGSPMGAAVTGSGTVTFAGSFPLSENGQEKTYTVTVSWPGGATDITYAGAGYGTDVQVSVTGTQA